MNMIHSPKNVDCALKQHLNLFILTVKIMLYNCLNMYH